MNTAIKSVLSAAALAGAVCSLTGCSAVHSVAAAEAATLAGTWQVQITLKDCTSGAPIGQPFQSLLTFNEGGTMTESTSSPLFYPAVRGPGHGNWSSTGDRTYSASSLAHITSNGALVKTQTITQPVVQMDSDNSFQTPAATVRFFAPDGSALNTACAAAMGKRYGSDGSI